MIDTKEEGLCGITVNWRGFGLVGVDYLESEWIKVDYGDYCGLFMDHDLFLPLQQILVEHVV